MTDLATATRTSETISAIVALLEPPSATATAAAIRRVLLPAGFTTNEIRRALVWLRANHIVTATPLADCPRAYLRYALRREGE